MMSAKFISLQIGVSLDETVQEEDLNDLLKVFGCSQTVVCETS